MNLIFFLKEIDGNVSLDIYHVYYFQVQLQLKLSETNYCDFVVWNSEDLVIQRLYRDCGSGLREREGKQDIERRKTED